MEDKGDQVEHNNLSGPTDKYWLFNTSCSDAMKRHVLIIQDFRLFA